MSQVEEESTGMQLGLLPLAYISNLEEFRQKLRLQILKQYFGMIAPHS